MWQLAHCAVTTTWVWFHLVGFQPLVPWQLKQFVEPRLARRAFNDLELPDCHLGFHHSLVVFDHGLPGGSSRMGTRAVQVVFASARSTADRVMMERIKKIPDPLKWTVVSSDHDVMTTARIEQEYVVARPSP